ncbi:uncharacterized protein LOC111240994 [Vigna radiata var. radiata]|uniref:Uncharacterized protein LOC111240994 n=1 Tax=Vigna radiata var. radiata TaxID=3916 RepID=A0A3Q0ERV6_VIGRR|nr:uncharacterized protein LOC111240994 [Vigna radiata var. radiata]
MALVGLSPSSLLLLFLRRCSRSLCVSALSLWVSWASLVCTIEALPVPLLLSSLFGVQWHQENQVLRSWKDYPCTVIVLKGCSRAYGDGSLMRERKKQLKISLRLEN